MNTLPADINKLLVLFALLLIVMDLILVRWLKLGKIAWKRSEYIWLGVAALGLISVSAEVRSWMAVKETEITKIRAETRFALLRSYAGEREPPNYICREFIRTAYSPPPEVFEAAQREYDKYCEWNKEFLKKIPEKLNGTLPDLKYSDYMPSGKPTDEIIEEYLSTIEKYFSQYVEYRKKHIKLEEASKRSYLESIVFYLSPILICFALALRITKITGEIKNET